MIYAQLGGLGNFIHQTPAYQRIAEKTGEKVHINFTRGYVRECFIDCPFIASTEKEGRYIPDYDGNYKLKDYEFCFQAIAEEKYSEKYPIYVDSPEDGTKIEGKYIVFTNGAGGASLKYQLDKRMTFQMLWSILDLAVIHGYKLVFVGDSIDWAITTSMVSSLQTFATPVIDDIRDCLYVMKNASLVIGNDTGLYHAAAALQKPIVVSDRVPNRPNGNPSCGIVSANKSVKYASENEWGRSIVDAAEKFAEKGYI